ncbi:MAG TPA: hypothetical protein VGC65_00020 [Bacteroidia bacterium]|jgi:hypothetical protein
MNEELCYKYLNFIVVEVERYMVDNKITDDELIQFSIEIGNFKEKVVQSNMPLELKTKVATLSYTYSAKQLKTAARKSLFQSIITGMWSETLQHESADNRIEDLAILKSQANSMMLYMKMNY